MSTRRLSLMRTTSLYLLCALLALPVNGVLMKRGYTRAESGDNSITVTGCLISADGENRFAITDRDGKFYILKSSIELKRFKGNKVALTGRVKELDDDQAENVEYREGGAMLLVVEKLKFISRKCE